jgi:hypothetical protein
MERLMALVDRRGVMNVAATLIALSFATTVNGVDPPPNNHRENAFRGGFSGGVPYLVRAFAHIQQFATTTPRVRAEVSLQPLDQGVEDRNALDTSLRRVNISMRIPTGFQDAFAIKDDGGIMRIDGALAAVFDSSTYSQTREGLSVDVPAATIWVIDGAPLGAEPGHGQLLPVDPLAPGKIMHRSFDQPAPPAARGAHGEVAYGRMSQSVWTTTTSQPEDANKSQFLTDQRYRRARLAELVAKVAQRADQSP